MCDSGGVPLSVLLLQWPFLYAYVPPHTYICTYNFFSAANIFSFSLKGQYKALGNRTSFLLRQDFLAIVLEENEGFPKLIEIILM